MATENKIICNCKQVSLADIEYALRHSKNMSDVESAFADVQEQTHCSTGCGKDVYKRQVLLPSHWGQARRRPRQTRRLTRQTTARRK